jgi:hypothetical protein
MIQPGTILTATDTDNPDNTFQITWISAFIDVEEEELHESESHLRCRYCVKTFNSHGVITSKHIWLHRDGRMSLGNGWWVKIADTQNHLLRYLMSPQNEDNRVRKLIDWLDCGLVELDTALCQMLRLRG